MDISKEVSFMPSPFPPEMINILWLRQTLTQMCYVALYYYLIDKISNEYKFLGFNKVVWQNAAKSSILMTPTPIQRPK